MANKFPIVCALGFMVQGVSNWMRGPRPISNIPPTIISDEVKQKEFKCYYCPYEYTYQDFKDSRLDDDDFLYSYKYSAECNQCYKSYRSVSID